MSANDFKQAIELSASHVGEPSATGALIDVPADEVEPARSWLKEA
jgi:hypothetical protein